MKQMFVLLLLLIPFIGLNQELRLANIFTDNMVLQRNNLITVWGWAKPQSKVVVSFGEQTMITHSNQAGNWEVILDELQTSIIPRNLVITSQEEKILLKNILVGEVWLCSGQSNMFWPVGYNEVELEIEGKKVKRTHPGVMNYKEEIKNADHPLLRLYYFPGHRYWKDSGWVTCSPETIGAFSATAYFFGRELIEHLKNVPVGLIAISAGGTSIQKWMTKKSAMESSVIKREIEKRNTFYKNPGVLFEKHILPVIPFAIRGFLWYQGESNSMHRKEDAEAYEELMELLIEGWRAAWKNPDAPFYFAQLPLWNNEKGKWWHITREGMRRVYRKVNNTGMAVLYDFCDPENLHPPQKQETGRRLALWALNKNYCFNIVPSDPLFRTAKIKDDKIICYFDFNNGLNPSTGLTQFQIINLNGDVREVNAYVEENTVVLDRTFQEKAISFFLAPMKFQILKMTQACQHLLFILIFNKNRIV